MKFCYDFISLYKSFTNLLLIFYYYTIIFHIFSFIDAMRWDIFLIYCFVWNKFLSSENLKEAVGDLFLPCNMPEAPKQNFFKNLFTGPQAVVDREELCELLTLLCMQNSGNNIDFHSYDKTLIFIQTTKLWFSFKRKNFDFHTNKNQRKSSIFIQTKKLSFSFKRKNFDSLTKFLESWWFLTWIDYLFYLKMLNCNNILFIIISLKIIKEISLGTYKHFLEYWFLVIEFWIFQFCWKLRYLF